MSTYITQYPLVIEILKYVDLHHPWVHSKCFIWIWWLASSMCSQDPLKYADLHYPWVQSKWSIWVWWLAKVCQLTSPSILLILLIEILKYVDLHHRWVQLNMLHLSMLTCKSMSTYITQYLLLIEILKYVDLHHPCVITIQWSMLTCITPLCSRSYEVCWVTSPSFSFGFWNPDIIDWYNWAVPMSMIQPSWYVPHGWR